MWGVDSTRAILIRTHRLTDTSLIVHWLTEDFGLIRTVAKGALRPKSPFAGRLDLFFGVEAVFQRSRKGDLHALREVVVEEWREPLRKAYDSLLLAGYWCRLLEIVVEPEHPDPVWYDLLRRALKHLESEGPSRRALQHFEKELTRLLGIYEKNRPIDRVLGDFIGEIPKVRDDLIEKLN